MEEGIAIGSRSVPPAEFSEYLRTLDLAIELLYGLHNAGRRSAAEEARAHAVRHRLADLREVLQEADRDFAAQMRSLTW